MSDYKSYMLYIDEGPFGSLTFERVSYYSLDDAIAHIEKYRLNKIKDQCYTKAKLYEIGKKVVEWNDKLEATIIDNKQKDMKNE